MSKPKAEDDLNAEETSSEEEDDLTREGQELKDMLDREEGRESWDEEDEDPDQDDIKGTSALFLQGLKEPGYYCCMYLMKLSKVVHLPWKSRKRLMFISKKLFQKSLAKPTGINYKNGMLFLELFCLSR